MEFASRAGPQLLKPPPRVTRRFASLARRFLHAVESEPRILGSPLAVQSYRLALLAATRDLFASGLHSEGRHLVRWRDQARASAEPAMRHPGDSLSVAELARHVGVPERTLRTAFQRCYGLSPLTCLRLIRLHRARRILRASCPDETTVTEVAFGLGFSDLGRFAGAYRRLFRELPSETLRRTASNRRAT
jgi:transcriptional regulator GlxA family with amidase domain